ncbi:unnamed protein product, partial [marine sediment metagenome]
MSEYSPQDYESSAAAVKDLTRTQSLRGQERPERAGTSGSVKTRRESQQPHILKKVQNFRFDFGPSK